ncbi:hypothetical protein NDN08_004790 [Rhodosorus marinus]|uniref:Cyclin n=1 Tax=Rhodosorus marinus TaxID=101924 RepID=A0AAV8UML8_9RHOD|nr:hypothetical protein NDN08_004790 [Rhodosorus marinus]
MGRGKLGDARDSIYCQAEKQNAAVEFVSRLQKQTMCSYSSLIAAFLYIDRLRLRGLKGFQLTTFTFRRLLATALVISSKYLDDEPLSNRCFSKAAEVPLEILNVLELHMLRELNFDLKITPKEFALYESRIFAEAMQSNDLSALHLKVMLAEKGMINRRDIAVAACDGVPMSGHF